jgi:hypothetical protein
MFQSTDPSKGQGTDEGPESNEGATPPTTARAVDPRFALWARVTTRVPGATRKFRRLDARARRGVFAMSAGLARVMLVSSLWGIPGGRAAINEAMRLAGRRPQKRRLERSGLPTWWMAFNVAYNDGGRVAGGMAADPRKLAASAGRDDSARPARPQVTARIRRLLPESMRRDARWQWLAYFIGHHDAAEVTLQVRRAVADGLDAAGIERRLHRLGREKAVRSWYPDQQLSDAVVDALIAQSWPNDGGAA